MRMTEISGADQGHVRHLALTAVAWRARFFYRQQNVQETFDNINSRCAPCQRAVSTLRDKLLLCSFLQLLPGGAAARKVFLLHYRARSYTHHFDGG